MADTKIMRTRPDGLLEPATPTPGDLSARPNETFLADFGAGWTVVRDWLGYVIVRDAGGRDVIKSLAGNDEAEFVMHTIAALSALPAAGGADEAFCYWRQQEEGYDWFSTGCGREYVVNDGDGGRVDMPYCPFCARRLVGSAWTPSDDTTPQPSAAEGAEGLLLCAEHGPWYAKGCAACAHDLDTMPGPDAAVGAQGEALGDGDFYGNGSNLPSLHSDPAINAEILIAALCARLDTARVALAAAAAMQVVEPKLAKIKANASWAMDETKPSRVLPRSALAAPAAGKGVDDAISLACLPYVANDGSSHASPEAADRHNALTRQPVAGFDSSAFIRFDFESDGRIDSKLITHDEMRQRYADAARQPVAGDGMVDADERRHVERAIRVLRRDYESPLADAVESIYKRVDPYGRAVKKAGDFAAIMLAAAPAATPTDGGEGS